MRYVQKPLEDTVTTFKETVLVTHHVHVLLLQVSVCVWVWIIENQVRLYLGVPPRKYMI